MKADEKGLIHGGFTFSVADYTAMTAVNHPNVILSKAAVKFTSPVKVGDTLIAKARLYKHQNNRYYVSVEVFVEEKKVFEGKFMCLVPKSHVLDLRK